MRQTIFSLSAQHSAGAGSKSSPTFSKFNYQVTFCSNTALRQRITQDQTDTLPVKRLDTKNAVVIKNFYHIRNKGYVYYNNVDIVNIVSE